MRDRRENQDKLASSTRLPSSPALSRSLSFRRATEDDLDRILDVHLVAYPEAASLEERKRWITSNRLGPLEDMIVAIDHRPATAPRKKERRNNNNNNNNNKVEEVIVGQAFLFRLRASFGGRVVKMGGIASVAIAPEARGRGVGRALLNELHEISDSRGDALTMLYAFRYGFYRQLGYGLTSSRKRLTFDPRSIPNQWRDLGLERVRAVRGSDRAGIRDLHARAASQATGWITRSKRFWEVFLAREQRIFLVCNREEKRPPPRKSGKGKEKKNNKGGNGISGYVAFELSQEHDHGETTLTVHDLIADDDASRVALLGALSTFRDQVSEITLEVAEDDPLERALVDSDRRRFGTPAVEHSLGEIVGGPMVRIEDVSRAIEARGYENNIGGKPFSFDLLVVEDDDDDDETAVGVTINKDGRAEVGPARGSAGLELSRSALASILYGGLGVRDAFRLGLATIAAKSETQRDLVMDRLDGIMRLPPLTPLDAF